MMVLEDYGMDRNELGYIVRVTNEHGDHWLGQRVYLSYNSALVVKHNLIDAGRYQRVYVVPATQENIDSASSVVE